jgi:ribosomal protein S8
MNGNIKDVCNYYKNVIIPHTPKDFAVAKPFRFGLADGEIHKGINAFRSFLHVLFDKMAADDFPATGELTALLYFIGVQGNLETEPMNKLTVNAADLLTKTKKHSVPHQFMKKMSNKRVAELFTFLSEMGFYIENTDYSKPIKLSDAGIFHMYNENDSDVITGLKLLATAQAHVATEWDRLQYNFMRCNFYPLANETSQYYDINLLDFVNTQPPEIRDWLIDLHTLLSDKGCTSEGDYWEHANFTYTSPKPKKMICRIDLLLSECKITPNTVKTKFLDEIASVLSDEFVKALKEDGCAGGCIGGKNCKKGPYTISHNGKEYLSCNNPPHKIAGFNIPVKTPKTVK